MGLATGPKIGTVICRIKQSCSYKHASESEAVFIFFNRNNIFHVLLQSVSEQEYLSSYSDRLQSGRLKSNSRKGKQLFSSPQRLYRFWCRPSLLSNGYRGFSPGVKRPRRKADRLPPSSAEVRNSGAIPPLLHSFSSNGT
jgi:hypothetical protein